MGGGDKERERDRERKREKKKEREREGGGEKEKERQGGGGGKEGWAERKREKFKVGSLGVIIIFFRFMGCYTLEPNHDKIKTWKVLLFRHRLTAQTVPLKGLILCQ